MMINDKILRVRREVVPVDDEDHRKEVGLRSILHVATRSDDVVELWHEFTPSRDAGIWRTFRVFGTGQPIPKGYIHRGTALTPGGQFVWHLYERTNA